jgi:hypothetical protein
MSDFSSAAPPGTIVVHSDPTGQTGTSSSPIKLYNGTIYTVQSGHYAAVGGGGSAAPGGTSGAVQFNNAGALGGSTIFFSPTASTTSGVNIGNTLHDMVDIAAVYRPAVDGHDHAAAAILSEADPLTDATSDGYYGLVVSSRSKSGGTTNPNRLFGTYTANYHQGSAALSQQVGVYSDTENYGGGSIGDSTNFLAFSYNGNTITNQYQFWGYPSSNDGTITNFYGVSMGAPSGSGTVSNAYIYWADDLSGRATNPYYFWADSRGVFRIKEDTSFNSVGQAIATLYNPQFAKYTAGAADFERSVLSRWNSNVIEIGAEAGGTGTLRSLRLLGSSIQTSAPLTAGNFKRGSGSPEGAVTGVVGDLYTRTDGGVGTTLYVKESGTGNTGWAAK